MPSLRKHPNNPPDTDLRDLARKGAHVDQVNLCSETVRTPEPAGQVGRERGNSGVNGPQDALDWNSIAWAKEEENVRRLRQRIFKATQEEDWKKVRNLQKLMLRSRSNTLVSVKRVTQTSAGRKTAGVDRKRALTPRARAALVDDLQGSEQPWKAQPVRRVYIPKSNGKQRPLGIPTIRDRAMQARVKNALEPEWEAQFEYRSYGFRPGRGCHDAIESIFNTLRDKGVGKAAPRQWILDADLSKAFDKIDHQHLMHMVGGFPARNLIAKWLKAGVIEGGEFSPTEEGTPQGGVISPLLLNIAMNGMETAAGCRMVRDRGKYVAAKGTPTLVRYADDFVVICHSKEEAEEARRKLEDWLEPRGLSFNREKTQIVHIEDGFDFLGYTVRKFDGKLLIKPSKAAQKRIRERLSREVIAMRGSNAQAVMRKLAPIIRGWSAYYRNAVSSRVFNALDRHVWKLLYKWGTYSHPQKSRKWICSRYFGRFDKSRNDNWVFGDRGSGAYLPKFAWTKIVRHTLVRGGASPDDPTLKDYWGKRRRTKTPPPMDKTSLNLAMRQKGICPLCGLPLIGEAEFEPDNPREWIEWFDAVRKRLHKHHFVYRRNGGADTTANLRLVHGECHRQHHANDGNRL